MSTSDELRAANHREEPTMTAYACAPHGTEGEK